MTGSQILLIIFLILGAVGILGFFIFLKGVFDDFKLGRKADLICKTLSLNDRADYILMRQKILYHSLIISFVITIIFFIISFFLSTGVLLSWFSFFSIALRFPFFLIISYITLYEVRLKKWLMKYKDNDNH